MRKSLLVGGISSLFLFTAPVAQSALITSFTFNEIGDTVTINYGGNIESTDVEGLSATTVYELTGTGTNSLTFSVSIFNMADTAFWETARISAIGFDADVQLNGAETDNADWVAVMDSAFPNSYGSIDLCFKTGQKNNCQGGTGGGLSLGEDPLTFNFDLTFDDSVPPVNFSNFGIRWQSLTSVDGEFRGASGTGTPVNGNGDIPPQGVPEPGALALLGLGLGLMGFMVRRRSIR